MRYSSAFALAALLIATAQSVQAQDETLAPVRVETLTEAFWPDPHSIELMAGGDIAETRCGGYVSGPPDVAFDYAGGDVLYIYAESEYDTTLLVQKPDGKWDCDDDSLGLNPVLEFNLGEPGLYLVWVGTFGEDLAPAQLSASEIDPR